ncbi:MAG TPA: proteasome accessory factor PafA2 family protein [Candidatus Saccharimonadales bacterium]|nr:proteasome accessory factor PafA2 family protein [Candidatus Saccharimonadales bacterium]
MAYKHEPTPPEAFLTPEPPERIIGIETEYDVRRPDGSFDGGWQRSLLAKNVLSHSGLVAFSSDNNAWLSNGSYIYPDASHLEYCTPESLGPAESVAAAHAGNLVLQRLVQVSSNSYKIFRRSATVDAQTGDIVTKGYHLNLGTPDAFCDPTIVMPLESHLATQLYAWGGLVTKRGYCISPKAVDIGEHITTITLANRTGQGKKPFGIIRPSKNDADTNVRNFGYGRFEDRTKTPSTKWSDFMGAVTTSILMRVIENPALLPERKQLQSLQLSNSVRTLREVAFDVPMSKTFALADGRTMSALDIQEALAGIGMAATEKLSLPADEIYGARQWQKIIGELRQVQRGEASLSIVADRVGWAGKYTYLSRKLGQAAVEVGSFDALRYCLTWDMVVPTGAGQLYDDKKGPDFIPEEVIQRLTTEAPKGTRANARAEYIKQGGTAASELNFVGWPYIFLCQGEDVRKVTLHPYDSRRPKLGRRYGHKW